MNTIEFTKREFEKLKQLRLDDHVINTECNLYIVSNKKRWTKDDKLLKKLHVDEGRSFGNKLLTINTLIDERKKIDIPELILPDKLATIDSKVIGFIMPYINGVNLSTAMKSYKYSHQEIIANLKKVGEVLRKMDHCRTFDYQDGFFLGDMHEDNIMIDKETGEIRIVDMDSCKIGQNQASPAKFLASNVIIDTLPRKYPMGIDYNEPNRNTDLLCYNFIVLNYLSGTEMHRKSAGEYYGYLEYLKEINIDPHLVRAFEKIYTREKNENIDGYLQDIPAEFGMANYNVYTYKKQKNNKNR